MRRTLQKPAEFVACCIGPGAWFGKPTIFSHYAYIVITHVLASFCTLHGKFTRVLTLKYIVEARPGHHRCGTWKQGFSVDNNHNIFRLCYGKYVQLCQSSQQSHYVGVKLNSSTRMSLLIFDVRNYLHN